MRVACAVIVVCLCIASLPLRCQTRQIPITFLDSQNADDVTPDVVIRHSENVTLPPTQPSSLDQYCLIEGNKAKIVQLDPERREFIINASDSSGNESTQSVKICDLSKISHAKITFIGELQGDSRWSTITSSFKSLANNSYHVQFIDAGQIELSSSNTNKLPNQIVDLMAKDTTFNLQDGCEINQNLFKKAFQHLEQLNLYFSKGVIISNLVTCQKSKPEQQQYVTDDSPELVVEVLESVSEQKVNETDVVTTPRHTTTYAPVLEAQSLISPVNFISLHTFTLNTDGHDVSIDKPIVMSSQGRSGFILKVKIDGEAKFPDLELYNPIKHSTGSSGLLHESTKDTPFLFRCNENSIQLDYDKLRGKLEITNLILASNVSGQVSFDRCLLIKEPKPENKNFTIQLDLESFFLLRQNETAQTISRLLQKHLYVINKGNRGEDNTVECNKMSMCTIYGMIDGTTTAQLEENCIVGSDFARTNIDGIRSFCAELRSTPDQNSTRAPSKSGGIGWLALLFIFIIICVVGYCLSTQLCSSNDSPPLQQQPNQASMDPAALVLKQSEQMGKDQAVSNVVIKSSIGTSTEKSGAKVKSLLQQQKSIGGGATTKDNSKKSLKVKDGHKLKTKSKSKSKERSNKSKKSTTKVTSPIAPKSPIKSGKSSKKSKTG